MTTILSEPSPEKDQLFVKLYLQSGDALDAYIRCGHKAHGYEARTVAQWMLERPEISAMLSLAETLKPKAPVDITRESIVSDYESVYSEAFRDKDWTAAIAAKKNQSAILGLVSENVQVTHRLDVSAMSDARLIELLNIKQKQLDPPTVDGVFQRSGLGSCG